MDPGHDKLGANSATKIRVNYSRKEMVNGSSDGDKDEEDGEGHKSSEDSPTIVSFNDSKKEIRDDDFFGHQFEVTTQVKNV